MIRVNLLPVEKRRPERPPTKRLLMTGILAALIGVFVLFNGFTYMRISGAQGEIEDANREKDSLRSQVQQWDALNGWITALTSRTRAVGEVTTRTVTWWRAFDALWTIINEFQTRHGVWVGIIETRGGQQVLSDYRNAFNPQARTAPENELVIEFNMFGTETNGPQRIAELRERIATDEYLQTVFPLITVQPGWDVEFNSDRNAAALGEDQYIYHFQIQMFSEPPAEQRRR